MSLVHQVLQILSLDEGRMCNPQNIVCMINFVLCKKNSTQMLLILLLMEGRVEMCNFSL